MMIGFRDHIFWVVAQDAEMFGGCVMAHKTKNMMHEVLLRVAIYNRMVIAARRFACGLDYS